MAQLDKKSLNILLSEVKKWYNLKIISKEQVSKIFALYKDKSAVEDKHFNIVPYISIFGSLMIGAGIILFFALNWSNIPKYVKVLSIICGLIASYQIGYMMKFYKANLPKVGSSLIFLGSIIYGAGIFLIAQIFNINSHWPGGFLYWAIGILPIAYLTSSVSIMYLGLIVLGVFIGSENFFWFGYLDRYYNFPYALFLVFLSLGIAYYFLGNLHQKNQTAKRMRYPYHLLGSFSIMLVVFLFSFKWFGERMNLVNSNVIAQQVSVLVLTRFWMIYLIISAFALTCIIINFLKRDKSSRFEFYELFCLTLLTILTPIITLFSTMNFWLIPVAFNIIIFLLIIGSIYLGFVKKEKTLINLGVFAFGISIVSRYFEYLWDVLNGYWFFIIGGLLLIFLAIFLEKGRKSIIKRANT